MKLIQNSNLGLRVCFFNNCIEKNQNNTPSEEGSTQCAGNLFKTKLMSQYIGSGHKILRNLRIQELVLKLQNHEGFLRKKNNFRALFWGSSDFRLIAWQFLHQSSWNIGSTAKTEFYGHLILSKNHFHQLFPH